MMKVEIHGSVLPEAHMRKAHQGSYTKQFIKDAISEHPGHSLIIHIPGHTE